MHLTQPIHKGLHEKPDATAIVFRDRRLTWASLAERVARCAAVLRAIGLRPGDRVGMMALNSDRYVEYLFGAWWAGGVINPVNIRWNPAEVAYSLDDCDTQILLVDEAFAETAQKLRGVSKSLRTLVYAGEGPASDGMIGYEAMMADAVPAVDAGRGGNDLAAIMYTGGTTGLPKGVMLTHANLYINQISAIGAVSRPAEAVGVQAAPMFHIAGVGLTLQIALRLAPLVMLPFFDEVGICEATQNERGSEIFLVPTMIKRLIEHPRFTEYDMSSLKLVFYGAAPMDSALLAQAMKALPGAEFAQVYGMTELSPVITALPHLHHRPDAPRPERLRSAGRPVPIAEVRIVDASDKPVPPGTVGEIVARGPMVMAGYWNKPEQTADALRGGWMHTGDGGYMDEDGFVYVVDRMKDMIVSGGENVYSAEVENAIADMPQVSMCAVIAVPDEQWGERVHAVIVPRAGETLTAEQVIAHCRARIAAYKAPRSVEFRDELPISPAGKLLKYKLREPFWAGRDRGVN
jgi:acyl-CoA synthetase (AMP-forming)/AMP-acid ligase II